MARSEIIGDNWLSSTNNLKLDLVVSVHSLTWMKDFVKHVALGMDGQSGYDNRDSDTDEEEDGWIPPCVESVRNYWNNFTGAWLRAYADNPISEHIQRSVTQFIYGPLKGELKMPERKRARRNHLYHFARQLWKVDWFEYCSPGTRVVDWALTLAIVYSSARIVDYIESLARGGSGRGLRYKDIMVIVFLNEDDRPELAMQLTKDAKNMTNTPHRRAVSRPLYQNPLLPYLAIFLSRGAFRDYKTLHELFATTPIQEHRAFQINWEEDLLDTPLFLNQSTKGTKRIENAGAFGSRHLECGIRAGFPVPPTIHDWRAEGLFLTGCCKYANSGKDKHYSPDARIGQAGQDDIETFHTNYQPRNAGVDGQATFLGDERRDVVNDTFRELTLPRNPNLWHSLPAAKQYEIENRQDWLGLEEKMATFKLEPDMDTKQQREEETKLRKQKARLMKWDFESGRRNSHIKPETLKVIIPKYSLAAIS
ncbi:RTC4-like domain-containing isoform 2 protein [Rutstroemia sp. NJR-2017a BBW]|nr:RTC4-like domain-containing isoform 2 protein [Rutstroemia sp. NJR-2017a BBW]